MDRPPEVGRPRLREIWWKAFTDATQVSGEGDAVSWLGKGVHVGEYNGEHVLEEFSGVIGTDC